MALDGKLRIAFACTISKNQFIARLIQDKDCIKTKTVGWGPNKTCDQAYRDIVIEAKALAKEYRCEITIPSKEQFLKSSKGARKNKPPQVVAIKTTEENPLVTKFGNELAFKSMIKHAIKIHGIDKTMDILNAAMTLANDMKSEIAKRVSAISSANIKIARIILETRQAGVDMDSPSKEIDVAIAWVIENDSKPKMKAKGEVNGSYQLNGEKWNGVGHAPASFLKYLQQNENHSLDDLRVN